MKNVIIVTKRRFNMKGFICINQNCYVNEDLIDKDKTYYDSRKDKVVVFDVYGNKYYVDKELVKGQLNVH